MKTIKFSKILILFLSILIVIPLLNVYANTSGKRVKENWPTVMQKKEYQSIVEQSLREYKLKNYDYKKSLQRYDPFGDYLNYGIYYEFKQTERLSFDDKGIPISKFNDDYYYNTVTVAQYALAMHGQYVYGKATPTKFLITAEKLLELQEEDGSFRYPFPWRHYTSKVAYKPGWISGMDYGQVLSVYARAYELTKDPVYLDAGNKAVSFLITPIDKGGVMDTLEDLDPSLKNYIIFEEFITKPANYTLNGFMFTLLGLYDWSHVESETKDDAKLYFDKGVATLEKILPYYDIGGFTAYDLTHMTHNLDPHIGTSYHAVHVHFCNLFYQITGKEIFLEYYKKWASYVDEQ